MPPKLSIVCGAPGFRTDAIRDHTYLLSSALRLYAVPVVYERRGDGSWVSEGSESVVSRDRELHLALGECDCVLIQYNPFSFGRWGLAPWLPREIWRLRRSCPRTKIALMVHESYVGLDNLRFAVMGTWQRAQLMALIRAVDVVFASTRAWLEQVRRMRTGARLVHLPVPSNLPDRRADRSPQRERLGLEERTLALATFGSIHPTRRLSEISAAANRLVGTLGDVVLLNLGAEAPPVSGLDPRVRVEAPGRLPAAELAAYLAAADIFMSSFTDGVSTRRGSLMAALQHGLPAVGTRGQNTDSLLDQPGLVLVPVGDIERFSAAVEKLAGDQNDRAQVGASARALYEQLFDWPVAARRVAGALELAERSGDQPASATG